jgi:uncharacterized membrane protein YdjX (TVP38/TMEM64 family)
VQKERKQKALVTPIRVLLAVLVVVAGIGLAVLYCYRSELGDLAHDVTAFVREQGPIPFLAALAVLPLVGVPVSAFYLAAGAVFPLWISLVVTVVGLAINITLAYWLARRWFRSGIERVLDRTRYSIPEVSPDDHVRLTLFLRLMPGPLSCSKVGYSGWWRSRSQPTWRSRLVHRCSFRRDSSFSAAPFTARVSDAS